MKQYIIRAIWYIAWLLQQSCGALVSLTVKHYGKDKMLSRYRIRLHVHSGCKKLVLD